MYHQENFEVFPRALGNGSHVIFCIIDQKRESTTCLEARTNPRCVRQTEPPERQHSLTRGILHLVRETEAYRRLAVAST